MTGQEPTVLAAGQSETANHTIPQEKGEPATETLNHKLFQTLYEYKSEDPDDLEFEAGEILQVSEGRHPSLKGEGGNARTRVTYFVALLLKGHRLGG